MGRLAIVLLLLVVGCNTTTYEHDTKSREDWRADNAYCLAQLDPWARGGRRSRMIRECLAERGWTAVVEGTVPQSSPREEVMGGF